jgi:hypothetical protein
MYENQKLLFTVPLMKQILVVSISSISPMAVGCFICVNINLLFVLIEINSFVISGGILFKISVLGINVPNGTPAGSNFVEHYQIL